MSKKYIWTRKHLTGTKDLSQEEIHAIFATAQSFEKTLSKSKIKKLPSLQGKSVVNLFVEPSTRTRISFEVATKRLSGDMIMIDASKSSLEKGESLRDMAMNIRALGADMLIIRHSSSGASQYLSQFLDIPVICAGEGAAEHPTQALLDAYTLKKCWNGDFKDKKITILGDILFSRVARSNIWALTKLGARVTLAGPSTLVPKNFEEIANVSVLHDLKTALKDADAVMLLRIQHERQAKTMFPSLSEYTKMFGLNKQRAGWLKEGAIIMHPGPINRGVEIDNDIADSPHSVILDQVEHGIFVRMAVLYLCSSAATNPKGIELISL